MTSKTIRIFLFSVFVLQKKESDKKVHFFSTLTQYLIFRIFIVLLGLRCQRVLFILSVHRKRVECNKARKFDGKKSHNGSTNAIRYGCVYVILQLLLWLLLLSQFAFYSSPENFECVCVFGSNSLMN